MVAFVYPLIIEAVALTAAFAILRLTFWMRDRRRQTQRVRDAGATSFSVLSRSAAGMGDAQFLDPLQILAEWDCCCAS